MKFAIIGSYGHRNFLLDSLSKLPEGKLVAAALWGDDDPLADVLRKYPDGQIDVPIYDDYRRMLDEAHPDVVGVFMPLHRLAEASIEAAQRGCHILSEKPLATTLADLETLRGAVARAGVEIRACFNLRGLPAFQAARQAVQAGRIGTPILAFGQKSYPFADRDKFFASRETYGGTIPWCAIHAIDFVSWCCGRDYARAAALHSNAAHPSHPGMEDNGGLLLEFQGGGTAVITFDYLRPWANEKHWSWGDDRLRIAGSEGIVEVVDEGSRCVLLTPAGREELPLPDERDLLEDFVAFLRMGSQPLVTSAESFRATEVALKARDAADSRRMVDL